MRLRFVPEGFHISQGDGTHTRSNQQSFVVRAEFEAAEPGVLGISYCPPELRDTAEGRAETGKFSDTEYTVDIVEKEAPDL